MNDILMTNIFFMITAISSVILTILVGVALYFLIKLIKKINGISTIVGDETVKVVKDIDEVRQTVKLHATTVKNVASVAFLKKAVEKIFIKK